MDKVEDGLNTAFPRLSVTISVAADNGLDRNSGDMADQANAVTVTGGRGAG